MSLKKKWGLGLLLGSMLVASSANAATYYVDYASGSDSNNGTSKSTPWKHAPGMNNCASVCASTTPVAGDSIIFKGGVTWANESMGWLWTWSGTSTTASPGCAGTGCIYIGVDQTWYTGGAWSRPILNAGGREVATRDGVANHLLRIYANYVIVDNLEFTGLYWSGSPAYGSGVNVAIGAGTPGVGTNLELKNLYIHGWSHGTYEGGTKENPCGIIGDTGIPNNNVNTIIHDSVIDGNDTDRRSCTGIFGSPPYIERNYIRYVSSAMVINGTVKVDGNTVTNIVTSFDPTAHMNGIEINASRDAVISNNLIAHLGTGTLGIWTAPNRGYATYVFNNVMYDTDVGNVLDLAAPVANGGCTAGPSYCINGGANYVYNNTIECGQDANPNSVCAAGIASAVAAVVLQNNHWITNATTPNGGMWSTNGVTPTVTTNLVQSKSASAAQGYTSAQTAPFSPTVGGSTIGTGTNLTSLCTGLLTGLCQDSSIGVAYDATTHTVTPNRSVQRRPATGVWDLGAYQWTLSAGVPPTAPSGLVIIR